VNNDKVLISAELMALVKSVFLNGKSQNQVFQQNKIKLQDTSTLQMQTDYLGSAFNGYIYA